MFYLFFFKGYGDHRDLHVLTHSFPTRRSSDLAAQENGTTTPVVPRMERPPRMPSRGFQVCRASSSPLSTDTSIVTSPASPCAAASSATTARIICRGTGLIAGSPTASGRRSEEHTSELQSLMRISYAVFCLKKKKEHIVHI